MSDDLEWKHHLYELFMMQQRNMNPGVLSTYELAKLMALLQVANLAETTETEVQDWFGRYQGLLLRTFQPERQFDFAFIKHHIWYLAALAAQDPSAPALVETVAPETPTSVVVLLQLLHHALLDVSSRSHSCSHTCK